MSESTTGREITAEMTINQIVAAYPETLPLLNRLGIDTCCGGALSLAEVARRHRFDFIALLAELERA
jgi:iron-sulfur cluster repair protein YtfE (RIC family)